MKWPHVWPTLLTSWSGWARCRPVRRCGCRGRAPCPAGTPPGPCCPWCGTPPAGPSLGRRLLRSPGAREAEEKRRLLIKYKQTEAVQGNSSVSRWTRSTCDNSDRWDCENTLQKRRSLAFRRSRVQFQATGCSPGSVNVLRVGVGFLQVLCGFLPQSETQLLPLLQHWRSPRQCFKWTSHW